jgi:release factor glutamine methyltransferase
MTKIEIQDWIKQSTTRLRDTSETPFMEARVLLSYVLGQTREWLALHPENLLTSDQLEQLEYLLSRLIQGEPLSYLTGTRSFFGLDFAVNPDVLVPRPETEQIVEECISWFELHPTRRRMADVGTGSGIIAICVADHFNDLEIDAYDVSKAALETARINTETHHLSPQIHFILNDLLAGVETAYDLIAANLPYIPSRVLEKLEVRKHEPWLALDGGVDGLELVKQLITQSVERLAPGGLLILEIESGQADACIEFASNQILGARITQHNDLANLPRIIKIQK